MRLTDAAFLAGRFLFGGFFAYSGINHFVSSAPLVAATRGAGVPFPEVAVFGTGVLLLLGGASVIAGAWPRAGLALLVVFLVGVTPVMHAFWTLDDPVARGGQLASFLKNVALLGASLALMAVSVPWGHGMGRALPRLGPRRRARRA